MIKYIVEIIDSTYGHFLIEAENEDRAREIGQGRLENGDTSWQKHDIVSGSCEITEIYPK